MFQYLPKPLLLLIIAGIVATVTLVGWKGQQYQKSLKVQFTPEELAPFLREASPTEATAEIVVINVWATWCGPCLKEVPELNKMVTEAKGKNISFLAATAEDQKVVADFTVERAAKKKPFKFLYSKIGRA